MSKGRSVGLRPFTLRFAELIGRQDFDGAIEYLRVHLKGNASDLPSLEMIAQCHHWAHRPGEAIAACRDALTYDTTSFDMHALIAQLLAEKGEHAAAANHARKGLECYPEPLPEIPRFLSSIGNALSRFFLNHTLDVDPALKRVEAERADWFAWANRYLSWYDASFDKTTKPVQH